MKVFWKENKALCKCRILYSPLCMHTRSFMPWVLKDSIWDCISGPGSRYHGHNSCHINEPHKTGLLVWDKYGPTFWKDLSGLNIGLKDFNYICVTLQYQIYHNSSTAFCSSNLNIKLYFVIFVSLSICFLSASVLPLPTINHQEVKNKNKAKFSYSKSKTPD